MSNVNGVDLEKNLAITRTAVKETTVEDVAAAKEISEEGGTSSSDIKGEKPPRYDRVEISKEGYEQLENQMKTINGAAVGEMSSAQNAQGGVQTAPVKTESLDEGVISSLSEDDETDLSSLTEQEMKQLVSQGKITKSQMENEMAKRKGNAVETQLE